MDQQKIGVFLKELRKEKGITQEQLADKFNVSSRTVSRWENGNNLPDLDILIEISDFYEVELREILNGEKKDSSASDVNDTVLKAADYTSAETQKTNSRIFICNVIAVLLIFGTVILRDTELYNTNEVVHVVTSVLEGAGLGMIIAGLLFTSRYGAKIRAFKKRLLSKVK